LRTDHAAAEHLGLQADFVRRSHDADRICGIGRDIDEVRIGGLRSTDHRRKIDRVRRIAAAEDDVEAELLGVLDCSVSGFLGEIRVGADDRHGLEVLLLRDLEVAA